MKKISLLATATISVAFFTCTKDNNDGAYKEWLCGNYNGYTLYTGPRGGCYYKKLNSDFKEEIVYVDRKHCSKCLD